jgi:hypothetical protein
LHCELDARFAWQIELHPKLELIFTRLLRENQSRGGIWISMSAPLPDYPKSTYITSVTFDRFRCHRGYGDMWPITWAEDGNLYGVAGDNTGSPMNFWRINNGPQDWCGDTGWSVNVDLIHPMPVDPKIYCQRPDLDSKAGVKPAGLLSLQGVVYLAVELHNYGDNPSFNRQHNIQSWIISSTDHGMNTFTLHFLPPTMATLTGKMEITCCWDVSRSLNCSSEMPGILYRLGL